MWPIRLGAMAFLVVTLFAPAAARADLVPDGTRGVQYNVSYENLAAFPQYVFFIYPTTNSGFAYRVEPGKSVTKLMMEEGRHGSPGTSLYAVKKTEFDRSPDTKTSYEHGDKGERVQVFRPLPGAVKSNILVSPPRGVVSLASPQKELTRVFRISKLTADTLELTLVKNEMLLTDGTTKDVPFGDELDDSAKARSAARRSDAAKGPEPSSAPPVAAPAASSDPPKKRGCAVADGSEAPSGWLLLALFAFVRTRRKAAG